MALSKRLEDAQRIAKQLEDDRQGTEDAELMEICEHILPYRGFWPKQGETKDSILARGDKNINPAATLSIQRAAGGMTTGMTPEGQPWWGFTLKDAAILEAPMVREHLAQRERLVNMVLREGGFYQAVHTCNLELFGLGNLLMFQDRSDETVARFECCTIGTYAVALNEEGLLDTVVRRMRRSVKHLADKYGKDKLSRSAQEKLEETPYEKIDIVHVVRSRKNRDQTKIDYMNLPWQGILYEDNLNGDDADVVDVLSEDGYYEMPYFFAPFERVGDSPYGIGRGHLLLGHHKQLNETERLKVIALQKMISPPTKKPTSMKGRLNAGPGQENVVGLADSQGLGPLYEVPYQGYQYALQEVNDIMQRIATVSNADLFVTISEDMRPPDMTLGEFMERKREKLQQIAPVISMYEPYVLDKIIERTNNMLDRLGAFPPPPPALEAAGRIEVVYLSSIAKSLRQFGAESTRALVLEVSALAKAQTEAGLDPSAMLKLDIPQAVDEIANGIGAPARVVRDDATFEKILDQQNEARQKQQQMEQEAAAVDSMSKLGSVPTEGTMANEMLKDQGKNPTPPA